MADMRAAFALVASLLVAAEARGDADAPSTRTTRPLTISGAANAILPSIGIDVSRQLTDRLAVGAQWTTLIVHNDVSLRTRLFILALRRAGLYLGANLHGWHSPLILSTVTIAGTIELGYEWRLDSGFTVGVGVGAGPLWVPKGSEGAGGAGRWEPLPLLDLRIGKSR